MNIYKCPVYLIQGKNKGKQCYTVNRCCNNKLHFTLDRLNAPTVITKYTDCHYIYNKGKYKGYYCCSNIIKYACSNSHKIKHHTNIILVVNAVITGIVNNIVTNINTDDSFITCYDSDVDEYIDYTDPIYILKYDETTIFHRIDYIILKLSMTDYSILLHKNKTRKHIYDILFYSKYSLYKQIFDYIYNHWYFKVKINEGIIEYNIPKNIFILIQIFEAFKLLSTELSNRSHIQIISHLNKLNISQVIEDIYRIYLY
jgi:hypothetical protein